MTHARETQTAIRRPASGMNVDPAKLVRLREEHGWSRQDLAGEVGPYLPSRTLPDGRTEPGRFSRDAIAKIENGERRPKAKTLTALCAALSCEPRDLLRDQPGAARSEPAPDEGTGEPEYVPVLAAGDPLARLQDRLSVRSYNSLERAGMTTAGEVVAAYRAGALAGVRNLGRSQLTEIGNVLAASGLLAY